MGLGALASFNIGSQWLIFGMNFFDFLDFVTANLLLPLGGFLIAIFVGWQISLAICRDELKLASVSGFVIWHFLLRYIAPVAALVIFVANLYSKFQG